MGWEGHHLGAKETDWWAAMSKLIFSAKGIEEIMPLCQMPEDFYSCTTEVEGGRKKIPKHIIQTHTTAAMQLRDPGSQSMEKTKGTDAHLASSQWNSLKSSPCPWISAYANILPCLARSHPLVMKQRAVWPKRRKTIFKGPNNWSPISMYKAGYKIGLTSTC